MFETWSHQLFGRSFEEFGVPCREIVRRGAFDPVVRQKPPALTLNHENTLLPAGSARIHWWADRIAVHCVIYPPDTLAFAVLLEQIKEGQLNGMSFRMFLRECRTRTSSGGHIREVLSIPRVDDIAIVDSPAYPESFIRLLEHIRLTGRASIDKARLRLAALESSS